MKYLKLNSAVVQILFLPSMHKDPNGQLLNSSVSHKDFCLELVQQRHGVAGAAAARQTILRK